MNLLKIINEIIGLAEVGDYFGRRDVSIQSFGLGDDAINFVNENKSKYFDAIFKAYNMDSEIKNTYTLKKYESSLISHFRNFMLQGGGLRSKRM